MKRTLSSQTLRMAVLALEEMRVDARPLLAEIGVSRATLADPAARISVEKELRFWKSAARRVEGPGVALRMAEHVPFGAYPLVEYLGSSCRSPYQALALFTQYAGVVHGCWHPKLTETARFVRFDLGAEGAPEEFRCTNEFGLANLAGRLRDFSGGGVLLARVHFRHAASGALRRSRSAFGAPVFFEQATDSLFFDRSIKSIPCRSGDDVLLGALLKVAEKLSRALPGGEAAEDTELIARVKTAVKSRLLDGAPAVRSVADELAMSTRSLQRKLEGEGRSMTGIVAAVRKELAAGMLRAGGSTNENVALTLGYSTLSAFDRAFKQWFKVTPSQYRLSRTAPGK